MPNILCVTDISRLISSETEDDDYTMDLLEITVTELCELPFRVDRMSQTIELELNQIGIKQRLRLSLWEIQRELLLSFCAVIYFILPIRLLRFFYITHVRTNDNGCGFVRSNSAHPYSTQYICGSAKYTVPDLTSPSREVRHPNIIIAQCSSKQSDTYSSCTVLTHCY